jgi:hypothetical protein
MLKHLWSHCRSINVDIFQNKFVYNIPIYSETMFKMFDYKVEYNDSSKMLRLTLSKPIVSLTDKPLR